MMTNAEKERWISSEGVDCVVVGELQKRKKLIPVKPFVVNENPKHGLRRLVHNLCFIYLSAGGKQWTTPVACITPTGTYQSIVCRGPR